MRIVEYEADDHAGCNMPEHGMQCDKIRFERLETFP
jgi:hypothetical protein